MRSIILCAAALGFSLAGCSAPKVSPLTKEPLFDKYGSPSSCEAGYSMITEGQYANLCIPEDQGCPENYLLDSETGICRPRFYYEPEQNDRDTPNTEEMTTPGTDDSPTPGQTIEVMEIVQG